MHNIWYRDGILSSDAGELVNIHRPFKSKLDIKIRKISIKAVKVDPVDTWKTSQVRRFKVPVSSRFLYDMHVSYTGNLKCQSIYDINTKVRSLHRSILLKLACSRLDEMIDLANDLESVIRLVAGAWEFDGIITDIPWLYDLNILPTSMLDWKVLKVDGKDKRSEAVNFIANQYSGIPLSLMSSVYLQDLNSDNLAMNDVKYKCPLILLRSNRWAAAYVVRTLDRGLPVSLFKD